METSFKFKAFCKGCRKDDLRGNHIRLFVCLPLSVAQYQQPNFRQLFAQFCVGLLCKSSLMRVKFVKIGVEIVMLYKGKIVFYLYFSRLQAVLSDSGINSTYVSTQRHLVITRFMKISAVKTTLQIRMSKNICLSFL